MFQWEGPVFEQPFELWREEGVLHLALADSAQMGMREMKELLRLIAAMDSRGRTPVMIDHAPGVVVTDGARSLLTRVCRVQGHPIAVYSNDAQCRAQLDLFRQIHKPGFPFRVFQSRAEAWRWARERRQLAVMGTATGPSDTKRSR